MGMSILHGGLRADSETAEKTFTRYAQPQPGS
jgi:hypothetical protein